MYSDGKKKTVSELEREAQAVRRSIAHKAAQIQELKNGSAKLQFFIDQLFRFFAPGVELEDEKQELVEIIVSNPTVVNLRSLPLVPIATLMANGRLTHTQRINAADNCLVTDGALIYFVHVLRFSPHAAQVVYMDISGTPVTSRGLFFLVEAIVERGKPFTLEAKGLLGESMPNSGDSLSFKTRLDDVLEVAKKKSYCTLNL